MYMTFNGGYKYIFSLSTKPLVCSCSSTRHISESHDRPHFEALSSGPADHHPVQTRLCFAGFAEEFESRDDVLESEFMYASRPKRSADLPAPRTLTNALTPSSCPSARPRAPSAWTLKSRKPCWRTAWTSRSWSCWTQSCTSSGGRSRRCSSWWMWTGGMVNEVKLLRKESRNMNARVTSALHAAAARDHRQERQCAGAFSAGEPRAESHVRRCSS